MDLEKSSFLDFFSYLLPNQLYLKDKMVSVSSMEQTNPGKQLTNSSDDFTNLFPLFVSTNFSQFDWKRKQTSYWSKQGFFFSVGSWKRNYNKLVLVKKNCLLTSLNITQIQICNRKMSNGTKFKQVSSLLKNIPYFSTLFHSTDQFELRPNCPPGQKLVEKPEGYICMEDIRRNRYQIQRNGE